MSNQSVSPVTKEADRKTETKERYIKQQPGEVNVPDIKIDMPDNNPSTIANLFKRGYTV